MTAHKTLVNWGLTTLLVIWLGIICGWPLYGRWRSHVNSQKQPVRQLADWRNLIRDRDPILGSHGARVVVIEFSDYQCPFCKAVEPHIEKLVKDHPTTVVLYRYDLPLQQIHPYALEAAIAARCADLQGIHLAFQDELFAQDTFADVDWESLASGAGVSNLLGFKKCRLEKIPLPAINMDLATSKRLQIFSTPTMIVNGTVMTVPGDDKRLNEVYALAVRSSI